MPARRARRHRRRGQGARPPWRRWHRRARPTPWAAARPRATSSGPRPASSVAVARSMAASAPCTARPICSAVSGVAPQGPRGVGRSRILGSPPPLAMPRRRSRVEGGCVGDRGRRGHRGRAGSSPARAARRAAKSADGLRATTATSGSSALGTAVRRRAQAQSGQHLGDGLGGRSLVGVVLGSQRGDGQASPQRGKAQADVLELRGHGGGGARILLELFVVQAQRSDGPGPGSCRRRAGGAARGRRARARARWRGRTEACATGRRPAAPGCRPRSTAPRAVVAPTPPRVRARPGRRSGNSRPLEPWIVMTRTASSSGSGGPTPPLRRSSSA